ncbi:MAG: pyridoxal-phosphate dependent enzyme [Gaiella sp.]|nr:pyridoxal-phosphate dependent enzyme [Gaiella sp.]
MLVDGKPRRRRGRPGRSRGDGGGRLRTGRSRAREARRRRGLRAHDLRGRRALRPLLAPLGRALVRASLGFVNVNLRSYYAEGSKTLAFELAEQLGWRAPDVVAIPIASGALFHKVGEGFSQLRALGLLDGPPPRQVGGQAEGCQPVATAFREGKPVTPVRPDSIARSLAIGNPADGDFAVATARATGGAIHAVPEDAVGENMALLARTTGVFGETATGVTLGALRAAVTAGEVGRDDRVVLLVTGDGLKTLGPVSFTFAPVHIAADADAFLDDVLEAA